MILHIGYADTLNRKITLNVNGASCKNNSKEITTCLKKIIKIRINLNLTKFLYNNLELRMLLKNF